ncbi:MAG: glycosyltransferase family 2 protein [Planctomycetaceae bacterium]
MNFSTLNHNMNTQTPVATISTEVLHEVDRQSMESSSRTVTEMPMDSSHSNDAHPLMKIERILQAASRPEAHASRTVVVLPTFNAAKTLEKTVHQFPNDLVDEIILVDDGSTDQTVRIARGLGLRIYRHPKSRGYAPTSKCVTCALERGGDYIVMLNPNSGFDGRLVSSMIDLMKCNVSDVVIGSRIRTRKEAQQCGIPLHKYAGNRMLTSMHNVLLRQKMSDCFSSFRAYRRTVLKKIPFLRNSDDYVFDSQMLAQASCFGYRIAEIPVEGCCSDRSFSEDFKYGVGSLNVLASYCAHKVGIRKKLMFQS